MREIGEVSLTFASLLREYRRNAGLSQEALAEHAGISKDAISALERGARRAPYRDTVEHLARALRLDEGQVLELQRSARRARTRSARLSSEGRAAFPKPLTRLLGREEAVNTVMDLLDRHRIITITGAGGIGKTRVAMESAARSCRAHEASAWFIDLASVERTSTVVSKIASALDLSIASKSDPLEDLATGLRDGHGVLLLDSCEHVVDDAARIVAAIAHRTAHIRILATSRQRLAIDGEAVYRLGALAPEDALELFSQRVAAVVPGFSLDARDEAVAADIVAQVDNIPLAIELAAARLPSLGLSELHARLRGTFALLSGGKRDAPLRQRTMSDTIAWSYALLDDAERALFRRLGIFPASWSIDGAEFVAAGEPVAPGAVLETLLSLVEKSLAAGIPYGESMRFRFLEPTRGFALHQLEVADEHAALSRRLASWVADFAEGSAPHAWSRQTSETTQRQIEELDSARAALAWSITPAGDAVVGARIIGAMRGCWITLGLFAEACEWCESILAKLGAEADPAIVSRVYRVYVASMVGGAEIDAIECGLPWFERAADWSGMMALTSRLALRYAQRGRFDEAEEAFARVRSIQERHQLGSTADWGTSLMNHAAFYRMRGELDDAQRAIDASLAIARTLPNRLYEMWARLSEAEILFARGDVSGAVDVAKKALSLAEHAGAEALAHQNLAGYLVAQGDLNGARREALQALEFRAKLRAHAARWAILHLAAVLALEGNVHAAARLRGYVKARHKGDGLLAGQTEASSDRLLASALRTLDVAEVKRLEGEGALLSDAEASLLASPDSI